MKELVDIYSKIKSMYEKNYDIHICALDEADELKTFIDEHWQKGHILTKSKSLLDWQHLDTRHNRYNFVIAKSKQTGEIHGVIGFILSNIYDYDIKTPIRWGAIWKVREDVNAKGLGLVLKGYMEEAVPVSYIGGVGLSKYSKAIDTKLGETMGELSQYYIANPAVEKFYLIVNPFFASVSSNEEKVLREISTEEFPDAVAPIKEKIVPYKSVDYFINRYFKHPIYHYKCISISDKDKTCVCFYRVCAADEGNAIFLVDFIGDGSELSGSYNLFVEILQKEKSEYICFPCYGIKDEYLQKAGFVLRDAEKTILPIYFEPFCKQNVELAFHFYSESSAENIIIVKGDADQDRPNRL